MGNPARAAPNMYNDWLKWSQCRQNGGVRAPRIALRLIGSDAETPQMTGEKIDALLALRSDGRLLVGRDRIKLLEEQS